MNSLINKKKLHHDHVLCGNNSVYMFCVMHVIIIILCYININDFDKCVCVCVVSVNDDFWSQE